MQKNGKTRSGAERILHWLNALAIIVLVLSGWEIFNAAPFYPITFASYITLGNDLTSALLWHFAAMWLLVSCLMLYFFRRLVLRKGINLLPISLREIIENLVLISKGNLDHDLVAYNHVQKLIYVSVIILMIIAVLTGFSLWKPVQLSIITDATGGYELVRRLHFWTMAGICSFLLIHVTMAILVPRTIGGMIFGVKYYDQESNTNEN